MANNNRKMFIFPYPKLCLNNLYENQILGCDFTQLTKMGFDARVS